MPDTFDLLIKYPQDLTVVVLGTFINDTPIDTVLRGTEGTMTRERGSMIFEPQPGVKKEGRVVPADIRSRGEGHADLTITHLKDFFQAVRSRRQPRGNLELAYVVQVPLIMAMQSHLHNKVAMFDADEETIRLV